MQFKKLQPIKPATAVVLVSAGTASAACAGAAQPKRRLLRQPVKRVSRSGVRVSAQSGGEPACRHVRRLHPHRTS